MKYSKVNSKLFFIESGRDSYYLAFQSGALKPSSKVENPEELFTVEELSDFNEIIHDPSPTTVDLSYIHLYGGLSIHLDATTNLFTLKRLIAKNLSHIPPMINLTFRGEFFEEIAKGFQSLVRFANTIAGLTKIHFKLVTGKVPQEVLSSLKDFQVYLTEVHEDSLKLLNSAGIPVGLELALQSSKIQSTLKSLQPFKISKVILIPVDDDFLNEYLQVKSETVVSFPELPKCRADGRTLEFKSHGVFSCNTELIPCGSYTDGEYRLDPVEFGKLNSNRNLMDKCKSCGALSWCRGLACRVFKGTDRYCKIREYMYLETLLSCFQNQRQMPSK
jgi:hypothetical protein